MDGALAEQQQVETAENESVEPGQQTPPNTQISRVERGFEKALSAPIEAGNNITPIVPTNTGEVARYANFVCSNGMAPPSYNGPGQVAIAIMKGMEVGLAPLQSLQAFYVINNIPSWYGDGAWAQALATGQVKDIVTTWDPDLDEGTATCTITREGTVTPTVGKFSIAEAKKAGLTANPKKPWSKYPRRMCMMRARIWAIRDAFADALFGMPIAEELASATPGYAVTIGVNGAPIIEDQTDRIDNALSDEGVPDVDGNDEQIVDVVVEDEPAVDEVEDEAPAEGEVAAESTEDFEARLSSFETAAMKADTLEDIEIAYAEHGCEQWPDKFHGCANHVFNTNKRRLATAGDAPALAGL